jgi:hypothetical protein
VPSFISTPNAMIFAFISSPSVAPLTSRFTRGVG